VDAETVRAIKDALTPIANKLGQGAGHLYEVFIRQQYVHGISEFIWAGGLLILAILATCLFFYSKKRCEEESYSDWALGVGVGGVATLAFLLISFGLIADGAMHILNPEYYAIKDIACQLANHCGVSR
jgi:cytochrome bd-type quinol oxidase subunit 2